MKLFKYNNYSGKFLYTKQGSFGNGNYREIQIYKYPFHTGLRILVTNGYTYSHDIHCKNAFQALKELKRLYKEPIFTYRDN